jgi:hypothetical protein
LINQNLHRQPAALDSALHRKLKLQVPITDWSLARQLNAIFLAAAEFGDACKEFPIVFVKAGKEADGTDAIAPIAVLGMVADDNLYLHDGQWRAQYMPAVLRLYPFCIGRIDEQRFAICLDMGFRVPARPRASRSSWMTGSRPNCSRPCTSSWKRWKARSSARARCASACWSWDCSPTCVSTSRWPMDASTRWMAS